jgi:nucleotidyltransferase/DNA polymerase involved in DNA repair
MYISPALPANAPTVFATCHQQPAEDYDSGEHRSNGVERFFGCQPFSEELKTKITHETGLSTSFGLASNKLISKVATGEVKPDGQIRDPLR